MNEMKVAHQAGRAPMLAASRGRGEYIRVFNEYYSVVSQPIRKEDVLLPREASATTPPSNVVIRSPEHKNTSPTKIRILRPTDVSYIINILLKL